MRKPISTAKVKLSGMAERASSEELIGAAARRLVAAGQMGLLRVDPAGRISASVGAMVEEVGVGERLLDAAPYLTGFEDALERVADGRDNELRLPNLSFGGPSAPDQERYFSVIIHRAEGGRLGELTVLFQDVTETAELQGRLLQNRNELALAQAELERARDAAEAANRSKSEFLANISHDLRTPLNVVIGNSEILANAEMTAMPEAELRAFAEDIRMSGAFLLDIISDLLDLSKSESGKLDLNEAAVDLGQLIEESVALMRAAPEAQGLDIQTALEGPPTHARVDAKRIKQVLVNLLSNAVKFTDPGGHIVTRLRAAPEGGVVMSVEDDGCGMSEEEAARAFEPFTRMRKGRNGEDGAGLGLAIVASLVDHHGGRCEIASAQGQGATVSVSLPAERIVDGEIG